MGDGQLFAEPTVWVALLASGAAGAATGVGALPALFVSGTSERTRSAMLGFGAGVMLAASVFSLLLPSLELFRQQAASWPAVGTAVGLLLGAAVIELLNRYAPHEHFIKGPEGHHTRSLRRVWLFVIAITLHNFPEGLAVGVGVASGDASISLPVTIGIGVQNMPEGLVVALALRHEGYGPLRSIWFALLTGLVEPSGGLVGFGAVALSSGLLPWALAFAAGAMLYVVSDEIIPESHRGAYAGSATWGTVVGFSGMMLLDALLG
jgi:zinc transporter, ZIP family